MTFEIDDSNEPAVDDKHNNLLTDVHCFQSIVIRYNRVFSLQKFKFQEIISEKFISIEHYKIY